MKKRELKRQFFIAVFPPAGITQDIADLKQHGPPDWEWKRPEDYHVSLAFPGILNQGELKKLKTVLERVESPAFDLSFKGSSFFLREPHKKKSNDHVLWARPDSIADNFLKSLHYQVINLMGRNGFKYGHRAMTPHLTVAKTPHDDLALLEDFVKAHDNLHSPPWRCDRFVLCQTLSRAHENHPQNNGGQGSRYRKIAEFRLKNQVVYS